MISCAVVDTNVLISALLSKKDDTATVKIMDAMLHGRFTPLWHEDIVAEYNDVLRREKFHLKETDVQKILQAIQIYGRYVSIKHNAVNEKLIDPDDTIFWQVAMAEREHDAFLITGNIKHFPKRDFVVTPAEMIRIFNW